MAFSLVGISLLFSHKSIVNHRGVDRRGILFLANLLWKFQHGLFQRKRKAVSLVSKRKSGPAGTVGGRKVAPPNFTDLIFTDLT